jgi:hypothetical protein
VVRKDQEMEEDKELECTADSAPAKTQVHAQAVVLVMAGERAEEKDADEGIKNWVDRSPISVMISLRLVVRLLCPSFIKFLRYIYRIGTC